MKDNENKIVQKAITQIKDQTKQDQSYHENSLIASSFPFSFLLLFFSHHDPMLKSKLKERSDLRITKRVICNKQVIIPGVGSKLSFIQL